MNVSGTIDAIPRMDKAARQRQRENASKWLKGSEQQAAAAKEVLEALDAVEGREREHLYRHLARLDTVSRIVEAFKRIPLTESERLVIQVVLDNPHRSSEELTWRAGWSGQSAWHLRFGIMCRNRQHLLWPAPSDLARDVEFFSGILADCDARRKSFALKPEAVEAFKKLGLVPRGTP